MTKSPRMLRVWTSDADLEAYNTLKMLLREAKYRWVYRKLHNACGHLLDRTARVKRPRREYKELQLTMRGKK